MTGGPLANVLRDIRGLRFVAAEEMRALIDAVSSRVLDEVRDECAPVLQGLQAASDACPDVVIERIELGSCGHCAGSGEGPADGTVCAVCRGLGVERIAA